MQIDELKENDVTAEVIDSKAEKAMKDRFIMNFHYILCYLDRYMREKGFTLEELRQQVIDKTSNLSKSQRDFLAAWKLDFIQECIDQIKEYARINRERNIMEKST